MVVIDKKCLKVVSGGTDILKRGYKDLIVDASNIINLTRAEIESVWHEGGFGIRVAAFVEFFGVFNEEGILNGFLPYNEGKMRIIGL